MLEEASAKHNGAVLVSFSGGKDSLCVLDLCMRSFQRVEAFYMAFIPGLEVVERELDKARERYGIKIHTYLHWDAGEALKAGVFCNSHNSLLDLPPWKLRDVYNSAMAETGITCVATGMKASDGRARRQYFANTQYQDTVYPLKGWSKFDVLAFMQARKIELPPSSGANYPSVGRDVRSLLWLHDNYPRDFKRLCAVFPYAEAVVWRRTFYGVGSE